MQKYAKIVDEERGSLIVGLGDPDVCGEYYSQLGLKLMEVELGPDGRYYLPGKSPKIITREVRVFAKDKIWDATRKIILDSGINAWQAFEQFLANAELLTGWNQQAYLLEDNAYFTEFYPLAAATFGRDLVDDVLNTATVETRIETVTE